MSKKVNKGLTIAVLIAVTAHLGLVIANAFGFHSPAQGVGLFPSIYCVLSGADREFGFFAPSINPMARVTFDFSEPDGQPFTEHLDEGANREAALRIQDITQRLVHYIEHGPESLRRSIAASWAAKALARNPHARSVVLRVEVRSLPSMGEYRQGSVPKWVTTYTASFRRDEI